MTNYKAQLKVQEQIKSAEMGLEGKSGSELLAQQEYIRVMEQQLNLLKQQAPILDLTNGKINEEMLTNQQILLLKQKISLADSDHLVKLQKITAQQKKQQGFLGKLFGGLKQ
jgi:hypothetical protein